MNMTLRSEIPPQETIEEFLSTDFFPNQTASFHLTEIVDVVQEHFGVSDLARMIPAPNSHGNDGTILECLTSFAILRLKEQGLVILLGDNIFQGKNGTFTGKVSRRAIGEAMVTLRLLKRSGITNAEDAIIMALDKYNEATLRLAAKSVY
jgi:hypothetical protein